MIWMTLDTETLFLRKLISTKENAAKVDDYLRTSHFRHRSAVAETTDFFNDNVAKGQDSLKTNHLDDFRSRSAFFETTDFFRTMFERFTNLSG